MFYRSVFASITPYIYKDLGGTNSLQWIILCYLLGSAAVSPLAGHLFDRLERRWVALCGPIFSFLGSLICSVAWSQTTFDVGMLVAGIGGGISETIALAAASEMTRRRELSVAVIVAPTLISGLSAIWARPLSHSAG